MATKLAASKPIILVDLFTNNQNTINETLQDVANLLQQQVQSGSLTPQLQSQLNNDLQFLSNAYGGGPVPNLPAGATLPGNQTSTAPPFPPTILDPMFSGTWDLVASPIAQLKAGVRDTLALITGTRVTDPDITGRMPSQVGSAATTLTAGEKQLAAVYGLMQNDGLTDPTLERFVAGVSSALGEYTASQPLFDGVFDIIVKLGNGQDMNNVPVHPASTSQWTSVCRTLRGQSVLGTDRLLELKVQAALSGEVAGGDSTPPSSIDIDLPDLEAQSDIEIQADNLQAMQAIYFSAQLDDLKVFQVVDKLVEMFQNGMLPVGKGNAGNTLYDYWKQSIKRMTETERRNLYYRTLGIPGGDSTAGAPNREFNDLWLRFLSAVSSYARQVTVENLLRTNIPIPVSQQQIKKSARDLGANLSLHGYGIGYFAATELQVQIREIITLLSDPDIKTAYGARDMWQVIDQVASLELGGAKNSIRYRTMATSGAVIIRWLAERAAVLTSSDQIIVLDVNQLRNLTSNRARGVKATVDPSDRDLVDACDQWLAVTGTADKSVEDYAQPVEAPNVTSRPVYVPQIARDLLDSVGIQAPGLSNGAAVMRKN